MALRIRSATIADVPTLAALLDAYMQEMFSALLGTVREMRSFRTGWVVNSSSGRPSLVRACKVSTSASPCHSQVPTVSSAGAPFAHSRTSPVVPRVSSSRICPTSRGITKRSGVGALNALLVSMHHLSRTNAGEVAMSDQRWSCCWGGDEITVETLGTGKESRWRLAVNGSVVDEEYGIRRRRARYLCCKASLNGSSHILEAAVGLFAGKRACRIFVDGELIGGDRDATFLIPDPLRWQEIRARGRARFLLTRVTRPALFAAGAIVVGSFVLKRSPLGMFIGALLPGILTGGLNADVHWRAAELLYQRRLEKLADPAWRGSTELTPLRRFVSLCLIGTGVVLGLLAVVAFVMVFMAARDNALAEIWLLAPLLIFALGVSLIFAAKTMRRPRKNPALTSSLASQRSPLAEPGSARQQRHSPPRD
jgi:hypothetical protein